MSSKLEYIAAMDETINELKTIIADFDEMIASTDKVLRPALEEQKRFTDGKRTLLNQG